MTHWRTESRYTVGIDQASASLKHTHPHLSGPLGHHFTRKGQAARICWPLAHPRRLQYWARLVTTPGGTQSWPHGTAKSRVQHIWEACVGGFLLLSRNRARRRHLQLCMHCQMLIRCWTLCRLRVHNLTRKRGIGTCMVSGFGSSKPRSVKVC